MIWSADDGADQKEGARRLGELRQLIDEYNTWESELPETQRFSLRRRQRTKWHNEIIDLATQVVGL